MADATQYCPACHKPYPDMAALREHLKKAQTEGDDLHIDIIELEGWDEVPFTTE